MIDSGKTVACRLLGRLNQLLNRAETSLGRTHLRSRPVDVDIVLSKACNLACTFCKDYETIGAKRISVRNVERIAAQIFPTARRLNICSGGEPYLHTGLENVLRIARRYGLFTWVLSNGTILDERRLRAIVREGLIDEQGFSVDGYEAATVEAIRVNARLVTIRANIDMLLRLRHEEGRRLPRIVIRYALMRSNIEELPAAVRHWGEKGIDRIDCGYLSLANAMERDESLFFHQERFDRVAAEARRVAAEYPGLVLNLPPAIRDNAAKRANPDRCRAPWEFVMLDTNGHVLPCYRAFEALRFDKVYDDDGVSFDEVWNSERYQALRQTVNNDQVEKFYPYCDGCENRCGWGDEAVHLGDQTWIETLGDKWLAGDVDHRRPVRGRARKQRA